MTDFKKMDRIIRCLLLCLIVSIVEMGREHSAEASETEILWDQWGVPHIYAESNEAMFYAYGYVQMEHHANVILRLYGQSRGRAAEYWGRAYLDSDQWVWLNGIPERAERWYALQNPPFDDYLDAFVRGMNDYIAQNPEAVDEENAVVAPVDAVDVLAHIQRSAIFHSVTTPAVQDNAHEDYLATGAGSNAWAIAPSRSASGASMLMLNPHLPWSDMFLLFEAQLRSPDYQTYGTSVVGTPIHVFAFNDQLGWTHTVNTHDGEDLYELTLRDGGYLWDGGVREFDTQTIPILVQEENGNLETHSFTVQESVHGPVIAQEGDSAIALRVVGLDRPNWFQQYWEMGRADSLEAFKQALRMMQIPKFTVLYADRDGHIMHFFGGLTPVRPITELDWGGLVPGMDSSTLWTEMHTFDELPRVEDPQSGWLQNANDPPWFTTVPVEIESSDFPAYMAEGDMNLRAQQLVRLLRNDESITFDEMIGYKHTTRMELADRLLDDLLPPAKASGNSYVREAAGVLENWDRRTDEDSVGGVLFELWVLQMVSEVDEFDDVFVEPWDEQRPFTTPDGLVDIDGAMDALEKAAVVLDLFFDQLDVPWGAVHRLRRGDYDLPANGASDPFGVLRFTLYSQERYDRFDAVAGDAFSAVVAFSTPMRAKGLLTYGNATQAGSPFVNDQLTLYREKRFRDIWLTREEVEAHLYQRMTLPDAGIKDWDLQAGE